MKAICFRDIQDVVVQTIPDPQIESPSDAIVRVRMAGLCGSDLHPFYGRERGIEVGTVMGHEFVGEVIEVGERVTKFRTGDRVGAPFTTSCGKCFYCQSGLTSRCIHCEQFGWIEKDYGLHGGQAEYVRVPLADGTLVKMPEGLSDEAALLLGDNLSTGFFGMEMAGLNEDSAVVVVGCGTVGLLAIVSAHWIGLRRVIAVDPDEARCEQARQLGAIAFTDKDAAMAEVRSHTHGRGADAVVELVGLPDAQRTAYELIRPGGTMSVIGCHCTPGFAFSPAEAYGKNLTYRTGRCPARAYMEPLAHRLIASPVDLSWVCTHRFSVDEGVKAYEVFANRKEGCIKAVIEF
ncbi:MAG: alcohol dehydrogenase catalytic domain-containing protein [Planctomycetota bacterium]